MMPVPLRILVVLALLWPLRSSALGPDRPHGAFAESSAAPATATPEMPTPPELENRPRSELERSLMRDLACTCGTCDLEPIETCRCAFAAKMRGEVLDELDAHDLSTEASRRGAAEAVRTSFAERYGAKVTRHRPNLDAAAGGLGLVAAAGLTGIFLVRAYRRRRAGRPGVTDASSAR